jgi:sugar/nucleoside kinase (ribokinase family)
VATLTDGEAFVPHFGGATANVCVSAARAGGHPALGGGAGDDPWGRWLRERLAGEGVDLTWFHLVERVETPLAFVAVDETGEPEYTIYAEGIGRTLTAPGDTLLAAVEACDGLFFTSNNLVGKAERELTCNCREQALELGRPVVFDPNLRLGRWDAKEPAVAAANACVPGALLVRCNRAEAEAMTGEPDPDGAAAALHAAGAGNVVVTLGAEGGAILRGAHEADASGEPVQDVLSTVGAGDAFMGVLLARLEQAAFDPTAIAAGLPPAVDAGADACRRWGAV